MATASGTLTTIGDTLALDGQVGDNRSMFVFSGTYGSVTGVFECASGDSDPVWVPVAALAIADNVWHTGTITLTDDSSVAYAVDSSGCDQARFRVTGISSGDLNVRGSSGSFPLSLGSAAAGLVTFDVSSIDVASGITPGTVTADKILSVDSARDVATLHTVTLDGDLVTGTTTLSETDLAKIDGITNGTAANNKAVVLDGSKGIATITSATITTLTSTTVNATTAHGTAVTAGASGTAGTVTVFPGTGSKGRTTLTATDNSGDTITAIVTAAQAGARTYTITDPIASTGNVNPEAIQAVSTDTAITIKNGTVLITKSSAATVTLAAPTATTHDGMILNIVSTTAQTHTVANASPGFNNGGSGKDTATFGGAIGDGFVVVAYQGAWYLLTSTNVTLG